MGNINFTVCSLNRVFGLKLRMNWKILLHVSPVKGNLDFTLLLKFCFDMIIPQCYSSSLEENQRFTFIYFDLVALVYCGCFATRTYRLVNPSLLYLFHHIYLIQTLMKKYE